MYTVNGKPFTSFTEAIRHAEPLRAEVLDAKTGVRKWAPPDRPPRQAIIRYRSRVSAYNAQLALQEKQRAAREGV